MKKILSGLLLLSLSSSLFAADEAELAQVEKALTEVFSVKPERISPVPVEGIYEVVFDGQIFYVSADGKHLFNGELFDLGTRTNLTENSRSQGRLKLMDGMAEKEMISYPANGKEKHVITVFTDIDCGYCRRLHGGMKEMNDLGITVRYMAFPRSAVGSPSYNKSVSVWCAKDQQQAMDNAKLRDQIGSASCDDNPVAKHMALGKQLGVTGTPAILLGNGKLLPGYLPPKQLLAKLEEMK